jgi:hypothetical protein
VIFTNNTCNIKKGGRKGRKKKVGCGDGDKSVELHDSIIIGSKLTQTPPPPPKLPSSTSWEVHKVWGKPRIRKIDGSNPNLPFYFLFFSKFSNLRRMFNTNPNLPTFIF